MKIKKNVPVQLVCGFHSVCAALKSGRVESLYISETKNNKQLKIAKNLAVKLNVDIQECSVDKLSEMTSIKGHQGFVAKVFPPKVLSLEKFLENQPDTRPPLIMLDRIQDPRNFGSIIRTASALGAGGVLYTKNGSSKLTASVSKVASGGLESLPIMSVNNLVRTVEKLKSRGYWILAGDPEGDVILGSQEFPNPIVLIVGGEGTGIRRLVLNSCDFRVRISLQPRNEIASLNASVATGILLHEIIVKRKDRAKAMDNKFR
ncbi:MAG: 23S rRNA (guanosine(2251)-2'-O)-methyltransferase RlmB [Nitrospinota bacterium]|nr:23S rRNA (guanosine(2251)-2'-O)-methyltransferase RlmB [Nitrospinota bacterium]